MMSQLSQPHLKHWLQMDLLKTQALYDMPMNTFATQPQPSQPIWDKLANLRMARPSRPELEALDCPTSSSGTIF
jgi:hypothetical protein